LSPDLRERIQARSTRHPHLYPAIDACTVCCIECQSARQVPKCRGMNLAVKVVEQARVARDRGSFGGIAFRKPSSTGVGPATLASPVCRKDDRLCAAVLRRVPTTAHTLNRLTVHHLFVAKRWMRSNIPHRLLNASDSQPLLYLYDGRASFARSISSNPALACSAFTRERGPQPVAIP